MKRTSKSIRMIRRPNIPSVVVFRLYTDPNEEVESDRVTSESSTFLARALTFFEDHDQLSKRLSTRPIAGKHQTNVEHLDVTLFTSTIHFYSLPIHFSVNSKPQVNCRFYQCPKSSDPKFWEVWIGVEKSTMTQIL